MPVIISTPDGELDADDRAFWMTPPFDAKVGAAWIFRALRVEMVGLRRVGMAASGSCGPSTRRSGRCGVGAAAVQATR